MTFIKNLLTIALFSSLLLPPAPLAQEEEMKGSGKIPLKLLFEDSLGPKSYRVDVVKARIGGCGKRACKSSTVHHSATTFDGGETWAIGQHNIWKLPELITLSTGSSTMVTLRVGRQPYTAVTFTIDARWIPAEMYDDRWSGYVNVASSESGTVLIVQQHTGYVLKAFGVNRSYANEYTLYQIKNITPVEITKSN